MPTSDLLDLDLLEILIDVRKNEQILFNTQTILYVRVK